MDLSALKHGEDGPPNAEAQRVDLDIADAKQKMMERRCGKMAHGYRAQFGNALQDVK